MSTLLCALLLAVSTPAGFTDNLPQALDKAKAEGKMVFMVCSGSDWCMWCQRLEQEVLSKPAFLDTATNFFELVYIDMPQDKSRLSEWGLAHNEEVCVKYGVRGFPSCYLIDADGKAVQQLGYEQGGAERYAERLKFLKDNYQDIEKYILPLANKLDQFIPKMNEMAKQKNGLRKVAVVYGPKLAALAKEIKNAKMPESLEGERAELLGYVQQLAATVKARAAK